MDESEVKVVIVVGKYFVFDPEVGKEDGCGDIRAIDTNIARSEAVEAMIFDLPTVNQFVICFHNNTRHFQVKTSVGEPQYQAGDRAIIRRIGDAAFATPNWRTSSGTKKEMHLINEIGIPLFADMDSLQYWLEGGAEFETYDEYEAGSTGPKASSAPEERFTFTRRKGSPVTALTLDDVDAKVEELAERMGRAWDAANERERKRALTSSES